MAYYGALRNLVWRILPPPEVTDTRRHVRTFLADATHLDSGAGVFFPPEVERLALRLVSDIDRTVYSIRVDKKQPDELALILITNVLAGLLPSGRYHTYRGVLSGAGTAMLAGWERSLTQLRERGYYTDEQVQQDREWIRKQIKEVG
jgi:hypothetical protein